MIFNCADSRCWYQTNVCVFVCLCSANISITKLLDWRWTCYWKSLFSWWRKRKLTSSCCCAWKCGLKREHGVFSASLFNPSKWLTGWHEWFTTTETSSENRQNRSCRRVSVSLCWAQWASPPPPRDWEETHSNKYRGQPQTTFVTMKITVDMNHRNEVRCDQQRSEKGAQVEVGVCRDSWTEPSGWFSRRGGKSLCSRSEKRFNPDFS